MFAPSADTDRVKEVMIDARIAKILSLRMDSLAMIDSLDAISEFCTSDTAETRKALRGNVEAQNITHAKRFLSALEAMQQEAQRVETLSTQLHTGCTSLAQRVRAADENMRAFLDKAASLERTRQSLLQQSAEISSFLSRYSLSAEEVALLSEGDLDSPVVAARFFFTLRRLSHALGDCQSLAQRQWSGTDANTSVGVGVRAGMGWELLDVLGAHRDAAHTHLFAWLQRTCEALAASDPSLTHTQTNTQQAHTPHTQYTEELAQRLTLAVRALRATPAYLSLTQDLLAAARRTQLLHAFLTALTQGDAHTAALPQHQHTHKGKRGGRSYNSAPAQSALDLLSHDSVAYAAAMLAWIHQALVQEIEFFQAVFSSENIDNSLPSHVNGHDTRDTMSDVSTSKYAAHTQAQAAVDEEVAQECVSRAAQGVGRPLRARLTQCLEQTHAAPETLYALTDLLAFYANTFNRLIRRENAVHSALRGCVRESAKHFLSLLRRQAQSTRVPPPSLGELRTSSATRECAAQAVAVLRVSRNALSALPTSEFLSESDAWCVSDVREGEALPSDSGREGVNAPNPLFRDAVLGELIAPLLQACRSSAQSLPAVEGAVYMLNNVAFLQHEISQALSAENGSSSSVSVNTQSQSQWQTLLETETQTWVSLLVGEEVARALRRSDLDKLVDLIEVLPQGLVASEQLGLQKERVETVLRAFYASLFSAVSPQFERLHEPALREKIRRQVAQNISQAHAKVYAVVADPRHGYDPSALSHTVQEVDVLLGSATESASDILDSV